MTFTVSDLEPRHQYIATSAQTVFTIQFEWRDDADIKVYVDDVLQTLGVQYNLAGEATSGGGTCTFVTPMLGNEIVVIFGDMPISRDDALYATGGQLPGHVIESDQNNQTMRMKQLERDLGRSIHMGPSDTTDEGDFELPPPDQRADKVVGFDSNGAPELKTMVDDAGLLSASLIGGYLYPQAPYEVAVGVTPVSTLDNYGVYERYGAAGDGVAIDTGSVAQAILVNQGTKRNVSGVAGSTYKLDAVLVPTGQLLMTMFGATFKGDGSDDFITPNMRFDLFDGTFDTFGRGINNTNSADPTLDLAVQGTEFKNSVGQPINIECPTRVFEVVGNRFFDNKNYGVRHGKNTLSLQTGWKSSLVAFNYFDNIDVPAPSNDIAAVLSYAYFAKIIGNHARDILGVTGNDTTFYYTKSTFGMVALNTGDVISSSDPPTLHGINLKGDRRDGLGGTPQGYGATALGNNLRGSNKGGGIQLEADWQKAVCNFLENFVVGIETGSGGITGDILALNHSYINGPASSVAWQAGNVKGEKVTSALNIHHGSINGINFDTTGANTFDRLLIVGDQIEGKDNTGGTGVSIVAGTVGAITRVQLASLLIKSFANGMVLTGINDLILRDIMFSNIAAADMSAASIPVRPYRFSGCRNVRGINAFNFTLQTTDATATTVFDLGDMVDNDVWCFHASANAMRSDNSACALLRRDFIFKKTGGTVSLVASGTQVNEGGSAYAGFTAAVSGNRCLIKLTGIAAQTWNATGRVDFEMQGA